MVVATDNPTLCWAFARDHFFFFALADDERSICNFGLGVNDVNFQGQLDAVFCSVGAYFCREFVVAESVASDAVDQIATMKLSTLVICIVHFDLVNNFWASQTGQSN